MSEEVVVIADSDASGRDLLTGVLTRIDGSPCFCAPGLLSVRTAAKAAKTQCPEVVVLAYMSRV